MSTSFLSASNCLQAGSTVKLTIQSKNDAASMTMGLDIPDRCDHIDWRKYMRVWPSITRSLDIIGTGTCCGKFFATGDKYMRFGSGDGETGYHKFLLSGLYLSSQVNLPFEEIMDNNTYLDVGGLTPENLRILLCHNSKNWNRRKKVACEAPKF